MTQSAGDVERGAPAGVVAVVLAAGRGVRFGGAAPKPLAELGGRALVAHACDAALAAGIGPVAIVVSDDRVAAAAPLGVAVVVNPAPEQGISSSLRAAIRAALDGRFGDGVRAVVVGLADQPLVGPAAYRRVAAAYDDAAQLAVATYGGVRGNPVLVGRAHWDEALALAGDEGARVLLRRHPATEVPCDGTGEPTDVDTPENLAALEARWRSRTTSE